MFFCITSLTKNNRHLFLDYAPFQKEIAKPYVMRFEIFATGLFQIFQRQYFQTIEYFL